MTEPKEIKLFDLKAIKSYDITAIRKSDDVGPTNGVFFILKGNLKLYLAVVDLFSDSSKINKLYELYDTVSYFLDKNQRVSLERGKIIFKSKDYEDCFCNIIIVEDSHLFNLIFKFTLLNEIYYSFPISHYCKKFR